MTVLKTFLILWGWGGDKCLKKKVYSESLFQKLERKHFTLKNIDYWTENSEIRKIVIRSIFEDINFICSSHLFRKKIFHYYFENLNSFYTGK